MARFTRTYAYRSNLAYAVVQLIVVGKLSGGSTSLNLWRLSKHALGLAIGRQGDTVLVTLAERKSRLSLIIKVENKTAEAVYAIMTVVTGPHAAQVKTLTYDNVLSAE